MVSPSQKAEKLPATKPERMLSDAPPSSDEVTISPTWRESTEVKTLTSSGMIAPASVPQEMMAESFHQRVGSPFRSGITSFETTNVRMMETIDVSQTNEVRGASKFISSALAYRALAKP